MIGEDGNALDEFLDEDAPLEIGCRRPRSVDIKVGKHLSNVIKTPSDVVGLTSEPRLRPKPKVDT